MKTNKCDVSDSRPLCTDFDCLHQSGSGEGWCIYESENCYCTNLEAINEALKVQREALQKKWNEEYHIHEQMKRQADRDHCKIMDARLADNFSEAIEETDK